MVNSKKKGSRRELEAVHLFLRHGFKARRSQQFKGTPESSDILCYELNDFNIESKGTQKTALEKWILKCLEDAPDKIPLIVHKRDHECWKITMRADDLLPLFRLWGKKCVDTDQS